MSNSEKLNTDIERGKPAERYALSKILQCDERFKEIKDVSDDLYYREEDVDIVTVDYLGNTVKWEVKADFKSYYTGNLVFEVKSSKTSNTRGCLEKTTADNVIYCIIYYGRIICSLIIPMQRLRGYINKNHLNLQYTGTGDNAESYLVPIKELFRTRCIQKTVVEDEREYKKFRLRLGLK